MDFFKNHVKSCTLFYTILILLLVTLPINGEDQPLGKLNENYVLHIRLDHLSHALMYVPWVLMIWYGWALNWRGRAAITTLVVFLSVAFAVGTEYLQLVLPYRTFNINDLVANMLGVVLGYLLAPFLSYTNSV